METEKKQWFPGFGLGRAEMNIKTAKDFQGSEYHNDEYTSLHICPNSQNVQPQG